MFRAIREDRPFLSEISGDQLIWNESDFHYYWQFAHILGKQAYPSYKLNPDNIILMTWKEHEQQTNGTYLEKWTKDQIAIFEERKQELIEKYYE